MFQMPNIEEIIKQMFKWIIYTGAVCLIVGTSIGLLINHNKDIPITQFVATSNKSVVLSTTPKLGFTTQVDIVRWRDADTPIVKFVREFPVRLVDSDNKGQFNSPEKNTPEGQKAKKYVEQFVGQKAILFIPSKNPIKLTDVLSFDRILGEIWIDNEKVTDLLIEQGFGSTGR